MLWSKPLPSVQCHFSLKYFNKMQRRKKISSGLIFSKICKTLTLMIWEHFPLCHRGIWKASVISSMSCSKLAALRRFKSKDIRFSLMKKMNLRKNWTRNLCMKFSHFSCKASLQLEERSSLPEASAANLFEVVFGCFLKPIFAPNIGVNYLFTKK